MANEQLGRPSKGDRKLYTTRILMEVDVERRSHLAGYRYVTTYLSDVYYTAIGRPDLCEGPDIDLSQEQLTA